MYCINREEINNERDILKETVKFTCSCKTDQGSQLIAIRDDFAIFLEVNGTTSVFNILDKDVENLTWHLKFVVNFPTKVFKHTVAICDGTLMKHLFNQEYR